MLSLADEDQHYLVLPGGPCPGQNPSPSRWGDLIGCHHIALCHSRLFPKRPSPQQPSHRPNGSLGWLRPNVGCPDLCKLSWRASSHYHHHPHHHITINTIITNHHHHHNHYHHNHQPPPPPPSHNHQPHQHHHHHFHHHHHQLFINMTITMSFIITTILLPPWQCRHAGCVLELLLPLLLKGPSLVLGLKQGQLQAGLFPSPGSLELCLHRHYHDYIYLLWQPSVKGNAWHLRKSRLWANHFYAAQFIFFCFVSFCFSNNP